jgi:hypothetical protein
MKVSAFLEFFLLYLFRVFIFGNNQMWIEFLFIDEVWKMVFHA